MSRLLGAKGGGACSRHDFNTRLCRRPPRWGGRPCGIDATHCELAPGELSLAPRQRPAPREQDLCDVNKTSATAVSLSDRRTDTGVARDEPQASAGAPADVDGLYRGERMRLKKRLVGRLGSPDQADDLVQDAFLRLVRVADAALPTRPQAYLGRIAANLVKDLWKKDVSRSTTMHVVADETLLASFDPHAQLEARDMLRRVEAAMVRLPAMTREIFMAHRVEGLSYAEIAERTGLSVKGVEKQMSKALVRLDRLVARG